MVYNYNSLSLNKFYKLAKYVPKISGRGLEKKITLLKKDGFSRVQPTCQKIQRYIHRILAALLRIKHRGHRVVVGNEVVRLTLLLQLNSRLHHAEIVSDMKRA